MTTRRILLVDDNASLAENISEILINNGYAVQIALNCASARTLAREQGYKVALVDLRLPDGNGTQLASELNEIAPDGEVILFTGYATVESAAEAVRVGAWAYLVKPYAVPDLLQTVAQAMRQVELREEKHELMRRTQIAERLALVGTMTAGLSHEIRNPLNAALLQLRLLERRIVGLEPTHQEPLLKPLTLVRDEIERLNRILNDFLEFARPRSFESTPVLLHEIVKRTLGLLSAEAQEHNVSLKGEPALDIKILGNAERLQQIIMNLLLNAIQATPSGGTVCLSTELFHNNTVLMHVDDSGPGVPLELRERIFEPFFTTKAAGSGLGLPIVHAIANQHGGHIRVSDAPQGGARFTLVLPHS